MLARVVRLIASRFGSEVCSAYLLEPDRALKCKAFVSVGHDEYWSGTQRTNVENARNAGVNLSFMSGNEIYWKTRWESSLDGSNTPYRTLVCYKETWQGQENFDPHTQWTGTWRDPRFSPPADGGKRLLQRRSAVGRRRSAGGSRCIRAARRSPPRPAGAGTSLRC